MAPKQEKGKGQDFSIFVFGILGAILLVVIFWLVGHNFLSWLMVRTRQWEMLIIGTLMSLFSSENMPMTLFQYYLSSNTYNLSFASTLQVMRESGVYVRWLYIAILGYFVAFTYTRSKTQNYRFNHTLKTLAKQESKIWPEIMPVLDKDLAAGNILKGPWRVSLGEWEFARRFGLLKFREGVETDRFEIPGAPKGKMTPVEELDIEKTRALLIEQLGPLWRGVNNLPPYAKGIYAALALRVAAVQQNEYKLKKIEIDKSQFYLRQMSRDYAEAKGDVSKMDFSWANEVIRNTAKSPLIKLVHTRHAYFYSTFAMMLQIARLDGVVGNAMYTWLRPVDRRLWYTLDGVGGYAFAAEACGIMCHWLCEKEMGVKLLYPYVEPAIEGLQAGMKEFIEANPIDEYFE